MSPESFDVYDQWFHSVDLLWPAQSIQPLSIQRIDAWEEINLLPKTDRLVPGASLGAGSIPMNRLYVEHDIAVWNSVMDEHNYLVRRWNEFLAK
jgi:putative spermidine/putrescine transport system substrate-binding protein